MKKPGEYGYYRSVPNKVKEHSRYLFTKAVRRGDETREGKCAECGKAGPVGVIVAHHDDYAKPMKVRYLCRKCHKRHHNSLGDSRVPRLLMIRNGKMCKCIVRGDYQELERANVTAD